MPHPLPPTQPHPCTPPTFPQVPCQSDVSFLATKLGPPRPGLPLPNPPPTHPPTPLCPFHQVPRLSDVSFLATKLGPQHLARAVVALIQADEARGLRATAALLECVNPLMAIRCACMGSRTGTWHACARMGHARAGMNRCMHEHVECLNPLTAIRRASLSHASCSNDWGHLLKGLRGGWPRGKLHRIVGLSRPAHGHAVCRLACTVTLGHGHARTGTHRHACTHACTRVHECARVRACEARSLHPELRVTVGLHKACNIGSATAGPRREGVGRGRVGVGGPHPTPPHLRT
jgi:hypothetical protein